MKINFKVVLSMLISAAILVSAVPTFAAQSASGSGQDTQITINGSVIDGVISNLLPDGTPAVDTVPHMDPGVLMPRERSSAPAVTASGVNRIMSTDPDYYGEYYSKGYVTVMDGTTAYYHYTRAELWIGSTLAAADMTGSGTWGYGQVYSYSWTSLQANTVAKVFYGW